MPPEENTYLLNYEEKKVLLDEFGKTPRYWMQYVNLVDRQCHIYFVIKTNNYDLLIKIWNQFLSLCFATNCHPYARYGTYYINQVKNLHFTHTGAREEIGKYGMSVRRNDIEIEEAIDLVGEKLI